MAAEYTNNPKFSEFSDTEKFNISLPSLLNLVVAKNPSIWEDVGLHLGIASGSLKSIKMNVSYGGDPANHFREVLSSWEKEQRVPFNWCTILSILSTPIINHELLADKIAAILRTQRKDSLSKDQKPEVQETVSPGIRDLTALNAIKLLRDCDFRMFTNWKRVSRSLGLSLDDRNRLNQKGVINGDWSDVMEEALSIWISKGQATWNKLIEAVEFEEKNTAVKMKRILYDK